MLCSKSDKVASPAAEIRERERHVSRPRSESVAVDTRRAQSRRRSPSVIRPHFELVDLRDVRQPRRPSPSPAPSAAPMVRTRRRRLSSPVRFIHPHPNYAHQVIQPNTDMTLLYPDRTRRQEIVIRPREEERKVVTVEPGVLAPGDAIEVKKNYKGKLLNPFS